MNSILGCQYDSVVTGDHGFEFQEEFFLYTCLHLMEMGCETFSIGLEVRNFPKFDDVVVEFEMNEEKYLFFIQTKHVINLRKKILSEHLYSVVPIKSPRDVWSNFNLAQYINATMNENYQKRLKPAGDHVVKYIILTNLPFVEDEDEETTIEDDSEVLLELFSSLVDRGAEILKFGSNAKTNIETIIQHVVKNATEGEKVLNLGFQYIQDHFVFVSHSPNLEKLTAINDKMLCKNYKVFNQESFMKIFRRNLFAFSAIDSKTRCRKTLKMEDYQMILFNTILEVDFPSISETFIKDLPNWIEFSEDTLQNHREELKGYSRVSCEGCEKLAIWKIYEALRKSYEDLKDLFVIPLSKISMLHISALEHYTKKLLIFMDGYKKFPERISDNKNIIFIENCVPRTNTSTVFLIKACRFEELSKKSKDAFLEMEINLQSSSIKLSSIEKTMCKKYVDLMSDIMERITKKEVCLGNNLPRDKIPSVYIERWPFTEENFTSLFCSKDKGKQTDVEHVNFDGTIHVVTGGPGMGKSCGLQNASISFKKMHPTYWVEFFDLKRYSKIFFARESLTFTKDEAIEFLLNHLITYGSDKSLDRKLLDIYTNFLYPRIFLFFDGFDEISPTYEELVLNLIRALSEKNISTFVTSRLHCKTVFENMKHRYTTTINPYKRSEMLEFTERYWKWKLPNISNQHNIEKFQDKFFDYFHSFPDILGTPILLKMLADITTRDCEKFCENPNSEILLKFDNVDTWTIYGIIFDMSFDGFYEKEGIDATSNYALAKRKQEIETIRNIHKFLATVELNLTNLIQITADVSKDVEILARGFVTRSDDGTFFFVHRTYAEYFCAECIFEELAKYNLDIMEYLSKKSSEIVLNEFVCRFLMEKIKNNYRFIDRAKLLTVDAEKLAFNYLLKFCDIFLFYVWKNTISEISNAVKFIENIFNPEEIQNFNFDAFYKHAETDFVLIKSVQVIFIVKFSIKIFGACEKENILRKMDKFIGGKIGRNDCSFIRDYFTLLVKEDIVLEQEAIEEYYRLLKKNFMSTFHRGGLFFLYFEMKSIKYDEELLLIKDLLETNKEANKLLTEFDTHYIYHVVLMEEDYNNTSEFIENLAKLLVEEDKIYSALKCYELDHYSRKNFTQRIIETFRKLNMKFVCKQGNSIFYYFWKYEKNYLMKDFLNFMNQQEIEELTRAPYFNGKSLFEYFLSEDNGHVVCDSYVGYIFRQDIEKLLQFLPPSSTECGNINLRRDFEVLSALGNEIKIQEDEDTEIIANLTQRILEDAFSWKIKTGKKILFLHTIVSFDFKWRSKKIPGLVYNWLCAMPESEDLTIEESYFLSELREVDEEGNSPLHIAASTGNKEFYEHLFTVITDSKILVELMSVVNTRKQNFFHCLLKEESMEVMELFSKIRSCIQDRGSEVKVCALDLLVQQDANKKTPFHSTSEEFFRKFIGIFPKENLESLFYLEDEDENMILHTLPISSTYSMYSTTDFLKDNLKYFDIERLKECLKKPNKKGKSPLDISNESHVKSKSLFKLYTKIVTEDLNV